MKAIISPRIDLTNRTQLENVIPLETPFVVFVDPADACNFKCSFCPTADRKLMKEVGRPWRQMSFDLYKKIANDLLKFPKKIEVLRLYKDGEPLINKNFVDMIKYAKDIGASNRIDTTTNAALLSPKLGREIALAGLDRINISIEGINNEQYKKFSNIDFEFNRVLDNVREFYENKGNCEMLVKINGDHLTEKDKNKFLELFGDITDKIYIEHVMSCWPNFDLEAHGVKVNDNSGIYGQEIKEVDICPYVFYSFAVNSDGLVSVCFLDWARKMIVGDLKTESIEEVWNGCKMKRYRKLMLDGNRKKHPECANCGQMTHGNPDNIDSFRNIISDNLKNINYFNGI
jgi:radical SAM protein with 4Fe4S-binding SPASM domain